MISSWAPCSSLRADASSQTPAGERPRAQLPEISLPDDHITRQLALRIEPGDGTVVGRLEVRPSMWGRGSERARLSLFAMAIDTLAGFLPSPVHVPTIDVRAQLLSEPPSGGAVEFRGHTLRVGGRLIVSEFAFLDGRGHAFGRGITTMSNYPLDGWQPDEVEPVDPIRSFDDILGAHAVDERTLELDPSPRISNALIKTPHGGAQMLFCELAAEHLAGRPCAAVDLDVHFLHPGEVGPLRATATHVGGAGGLDTFRVDLTDVGADDALVGAATVMSRPIGDR